MTLEQEILATYTNPVAVYSINQISKRIGRSYPYVNKKVQELTQQGILQKKPTGRSHLCSINLHNKHAVILLALNELEKHQDIPKQTLEEAKQLDEQKHLNQQNAIIYDPTTKELLIIAPNKPQPPTKAKHLTTQELKKKLLENKTFYEQRIIISGHEHFFSLLAEPSIQQRYHPLL